METKELPALFDQAPAVRFIDRLTKRVGEDLTDEVRKRTPISQPPPGISMAEWAAHRGRAPGTLRGSWYTGELEHQHNVMGVEGRAIESMTNDPVAPDVEYPTRPHLIRPSLTRAPATVLASGNPRKSGSDPAARLRFINAFGRVVYAQEVWHPGTQGTHMMRDALTEIDATWVEEHGKPELTTWAKETTHLV